MKRTVARPLPSGNPAPTAPTLRVYLRRSLGEEKQAESIDAQREVCARFRLPLGFDWPARVEYIDSERSGDNFAGRAGLQSLLRETKAGDVIVTRDSSRIGRDALECAIVTRDLVQYQGARLFYAATGEEAKSSTAIDAGMNVMRGMSAQMELEGIRSRTRDALRLRAVQGYAPAIAPFGYRHVRVDASGAPVRDQWDKAAGKVRREIDPEEAVIVHRIFAEYAAGRGWIHIAKSLNNEGIASPRGGAWNPVVIGAMLRNTHYKGIIVYGVTRCVRVAGERERIPCDDPVILNRPDLVIVDAETFDAVQAQIQARKRPHYFKNQNAAKHPLVGVGRCDRCGGAIMAATGPRYTCATHNRKGPGACPIKVRQRAEAVEGPLRAYLLANVLGAVEEAIKRAVAAYCARVREMEPPNIAELDEQIATLKKVQKRLVALAVETDDPIPEIADKLRVNRERITALEARKREAERAPSGEAVQGEIEQACMERLHFIRGMLTSDRDGMREAFRALFPHGLRFVDGGDGVWEIVGTASVGDGGSGGGKPFTSEKIPYDVQHRWRRRRTRRLGARRRERIPAVR